MDQLPNDKSQEVSVELMEAFNKTLSEYMKRNRISQGAVCVTKEDQTLVHLGVGTNPDTVFRIASITKAITRAAIQLLVSERKLPLDTKVLPLLNLPLSDGTDPLLGRITVQQLLNHSGGWDIAVMGYDPTFYSDEIAKALNKPISELTPVDTVRFMITKPPQFEPGSKSVYSNFGYIVLGRVIETISGQTYETFIQNKLMKPLGITGIRIGNSNKDEHEAFYEDDNYDPYKINMATNDSCGGLVSTAKDLCKFMEYYWINGDKRGEGEKMKCVSFGGLPGTKTIALQALDGTNIAVFFNRRNGQNPNDHEELLKLIEDLIEK